MENFTPDESATTLFSEKAWLQGALLAAVAYGVELILFMMSFYLLTKRISHSDDKKVKIFLSIYITVLFFLGTFFYAATAQFTQLAFIDNRNIPGGPNQYELTMFSIPIDELASVCAVMTTWLCDAMIVWRCRIIYTWSKYPLRVILVFPYLLFLSSFVMGLLFLIQISKNAPWNADSMLSTVNWTIPFLSVSLSLNVVVTGAIVLQLLIYRQTIRSTMGSYYGKHYTSMAAMVVESASIFAVFSLLLLVPFALNYPLNFTFFQALSVVQIVSVLLLIFRIAQGKGWTANAENPFTSNQNRVSVPRFVSHSIPPVSSPVLGPEIKDSSTTALNNRMSHFNGESNYIGVDSREALDRTGSMA